MIVEALESYAKVTDPWLQAWNATNAMAISATRIAVGQMELAALTTRFMNQRLAAYASFDGRVEPFVQRLDKLTEQYGGRVCRSGSRDLFVVVGHPARGPAADRGGRADGRRRDGTAPRSRAEAKVDGRRDEKAAQKREAAAH